MRLSTHEEQRLLALKRYKILDTSADACFDRLTAIASKFFNMPIVLITFVDENRIWIKSKYGLEDINQFSREPGLCGSTILSDSANFIQNARYDARTMANTLVAGEFGLQFYAGVPIKSSDNQNIGTFCLLDKKPRYLNADQLALLNELGKLVSEELEIRLHAQKDHRSLEQRINELEMLLSSRSGSA